MKSLHPPILISKKNILIHELTDQYVSFIFRTLCFLKEFTVYGLTVSNHPLEKVYDSKTNVVIMISNGEVIGLDN